MTPFAHIAAGYLVTQALDLVSPGLGFNTPGIIMTGVIAGNIPDFDLIFVKRKWEHRNTITHAPIFWVVLVALMFAALKIPGLGIYYPYVLVFAIAVASHFFTDWYAAREVDMGGIRLFYPFSKKHYGLLPLTKAKYKVDNFKKIDWNRYLKYYMESSFLFYSEIFLIALGMAVFFVRSYDMFFSFFIR